MINYLRQRAPSYHRQSCSRCLTKKKSTGRWEGIFMRESNCSFSGKIPSSISLTYMQGMALFDPVSDRSWNCINMDIGLLSDFFRYLPKQLELRNRHTNFAPLLFLSCIFRHLKEFCTCWPLEDRTPYNSVLLLCRFMFSERSFWTYFFAYYNRFCNRNVENGNISSTYTQE